MPVNPRKDAFKSEIMSVMRNLGRRDSMAKADLIAAVRKAQPELFDDNEACYPGCKSKHPKWRHEFDRAVYDLTHTRPPKISASQIQRGEYLLG